MRDLDPEPSAVLLVSHDTERAGAQRCLLELAHTLKNDLGRHVELATGGGGELLGELEAVAPVARLQGGEHGLRAAAGALVAEFRSRWPEGLIVVNTAALADVYRALEDKGIRDALAWVHELPASIDASYGGADTMALIQRVARRIVVPCDHARDALLSHYAVPPSTVVALQNGIARSILRGAGEVDRERARRSLRDRIGASPDSLIVLGCGIPEGRKGVDLFGLVGAEVCRRADSLPVHFVWLGKEIEADVRRLARDAMQGHSGALHFLGSSSAPEVIYAGADLVLIPSRVDASPLVNAEAMLFGLPVVFFEDRGGVAEQQPPGLGLGVAGFDTHAMADRVLDLLHDAGRRHEIGRALAAHARSSVPWKRFAQVFLALGADRGKDVLATADRIQAEHPRSSAPVAPGPRILLILPDLEIGGGQLNAIRLANALTATHQVFMLNARPEQYDPSVAELVSPAVVPLEGGLDRRPWYDPAEPWTRDSNNTDEREARIGVVAELIRRCRITTVLSQVWWSDRFALALRERVEFAWFVKFCGCYEALLRAPIMDPRFVEKARRILGSVTGATYGSPQSLRLFDDPRFPRPRALRRVFNGFSRQLIDRQAGGAPPRSGSDFVYCISSRAIREKGWEEAILAVSRINRMPAADRGGRRARLWLIGDGPVLAPLRIRYAGDGDVVFLGPRSRPHAVMAAADAGLLPSCTESVPTALIESLACDRPVVATAVGAVPEMLAWGSLEAGILVPTVADHESVPIEALATAMLRYMVDDELYRQHRSAAATVFDAHFDMSTTLHSYVSFFNEARR